jgi:hypothetical protein
MVESFDVETFPITFNNIGMDTESGADLARRIQDVEGTFPFVAIVAVFLSVQLKAKRVNRPSLDQHDELRPAVQRIEKQSYAKGGLANERVCQSSLNSNAEMGKKRGVTCSNSARRSPEAACIISSNASPTPTSDDQQAQLHPA